jgi:hypothetical protein
MAPLKFIVKHFSEIRIKSKPVRRRFVARLVACEGLDMRDYAPQIACACQRSMGYNPRPFLHGRSSPEVTP